MKIPLLLLALASAPKVAVLPIDPGPLDAASAAEIDEEVRADARRALGADALLDSAHVAEVLGSARLSAEESAGKLGAAVLSGTTKRMEGAIAVSLVLVSEAGKPLGKVRLVGITVAEVRDDTQGKLEKFLREAFGLSPAERSDTSPTAAERPAPTQPAPPRRTSSPGNAASVAPGHAGASPVPVRAPRPKPPRRERSEPAESEPPPPPPPGAPHGAAGTPRTPAGGDEAAPAVATQGASAPLVATIREIVEQVEAVRGLRRKAPLKVEILDEAAFSRALRAKAESELTPKAVAAERARWTAFGLAPASADPRRVLLSVLDEQVAGFYDPSTKSLTVRAEPPASAAAMGPDALRLVLAHEIEHALQDQSFGFPDLSKLPDDDVRLARMAVYEGDAMATMIAVAARSAQGPVGPALAAAAAAVQSMSAEQMLAQSGLSPELLQAPAIVREEMLLPYAAGLALVAEVHRRGGWGLVDRMFRRPPTTTHQVLHPDAYLGGEEPAPVPFPGAPEGMQVISTGRMGELGTRMALAACVDGQVAKDFARSWVGDAYTIARGSGDSIALLWSTSWAADGAKTFANLIEMQSVCWQEAAQAPRIARGWRISADSEVRVDGPKAGLARGLPQLALRAAAASAVAFTAQRPAALPPLGPIVEPASTAKGRGVVGKVAVDGAPD